MLLLLEFYFRKYLSKMFLSVVSKEVACVNLCVPFKDIYRHDCEKELKMYIFSQKVIKVEIFSKELF